MKPETPVVKKEVIVQKEVVAQKEKKEAAPKIKSVSTKQEKKIESIVDIIAEQEPIIITI